MIPNDFFNAYLEAAKATQVTSNVPAAFTLAQAAVESSWGESQQCKQDFNFFGIKAIGGWTGATQNWPTSEFLQGHYITIQAPFRKYASVTEGFEDHAKFLTDNQRYEDAFVYVDDPCEFAGAIARAGYATDPHYCETITSIIKFHNLIDFCK